MKVDDEGNPIDEQDQDQNAQDAQDPEDDFLAGFNESEKDQGGDQDPDKDDKGDQDPGDKTDDPGTDDGSKGDPDDPQGGDDDKGGDDDPGADDKDPGGDDDPEGYKARYEELRGSFNTELNKRDTELQELRKLASKSEKASIKDTLLEKLKDGLSDDDKEYMADNPTTGKLFQNLIEQLVDILPDNGGPQAAAPSASDQDPGTAPAVDQAYDTSVSKKYPDWIKTVNDPVFLTWQATLGEEDAKLYVSPDPVDGVRLLDKFTAHRTATNQTKHKEKQAEEARRKKEQARGSHTGGGDSKPDPDTDMDDFAAGFNEA